MEEILHKIRNYTFKILSILSYITACYVVIRTAIDFTSISIFLSQLIALLLIGYFFNLASRENRTVFQERSLKGIFYLYYLFVLYFLCILTVAFTGYSGLFKAILFFVILYAINVLILRKIKSNKSNNFENTNTIIDFNNFQTLSLGMKIKKLIHSISLIFAYIILVELVVWAFGNVYFIDIVPYILLTLYLYFATLSEPTPSQKYIFKLINVLYFIGIIYIIYQLSFN